MQPALRALPAQRHQPARGNLARPVGPHPRAGAHLRLAPHLAHRRRANLALALLRHPRAGADHSGCGATSPPTAHNFLGLVSRLEQYHDVLPAMSFSLDGTTEETHDHIRGAGSFRRVSSPSPRSLPWVRRHRAVRRQPAQPPGARVMPGLCKSLGAQALFVCHTQPTRSLYEAGLQLGPGRLARGRGGGTSNRAHHRRRQATTEIGAWGPGVPAPCLACRCARSTSITAVASPSAASSLVRATTKPTWSPT